MSLHQGYPCSLLSISAHFRMLMKGGWFQAEVDFNFRLRAMYGCVILRVLEWISKRLEDLYFLRAPYISLG